MTLAALTGLLAVGSFLFSWQRSRVTEGNFRHIHKGMTRAEVETVVGPPGDFTTGPVMRHRSMMVDSPNYRWRTDQEWVWSTDERLYFVEFDGNGLVEDYSSEACSRESQSSIENARWRAKRLWYRWFSGN